MVEPEQPQYVTSVQEIPIEQQVQNLISQENNVILQQAPKVRNLISQENNVILQQALKVTHEMWRFKFRQFTPKNYRDDR